MSLINDMLHDLEKRRGAEMREVPAYQVPIIGSRGSRGRKVLLWVGGIALVAGLIWAIIFVVPLFVIQPEEVVETAEQSSVKPTPTPLEKRELSENNLKTVSGAPVHDEQPAPSTQVVTTTKVKDDKAGLNMLLPGAKLHEKNNRAELTLLFNHAPKYQVRQAGEEDDSLLVEFSEVLPEEELNVTTLMAGLKGELVTDIELHRQSEGIQLMIGLAEHTTLERLAVKEQQRVGGEDVFLFSALFLRSVEIEDVARIEAEHPRKKVVPVTVEQPRLQSESLPEESTAEPPTVKASALTKTTNPLSNDRQSYLEGMKYFREGDLLAAVDSFRKALAENPALIEARLGLVDVLLGQGKRVEAIAEIRSGLETSPGNSSIRRKYARLLFDEGRYAEAIELLQKQPIPKLSGDPAYHALLGALLREAERFREAAEVYGRLLQLRPDEPLWWLGLAVSMDQIGETDQARLAYRRALALPGLTPQLQSYIQDRLQIL